MESIKKSVDIEISDEEDYEVDYQKEYEGGGHNDEVIMTPRIEDT